MLHSNYVETSNPHHLARPPAWFLARLAAYDPQFLIFPSVKHAYYCTGRRGRYERGLDRPIPTAPDSAIYIRERAWPWKPILPEPCHVQGWAGILLLIPEFDTQRHGNDPGKDLDDAEDAAERAMNIRIADQADVLATDSYGAYALMTGSRVGSGSRKHGGSNDKLGLKRPSRRRRSRRPVVENQPGAFWLGRR